MNYFSGANGDEGSPPATVEGDDPLKWERMYYSSGRQTSLDAQLDQQGDDGFEQPAISAEVDTAKSDIRVVTFDLDNTVWRTMETISDANDALARHLKESFGIDERSEKRMGKLFKEHPDRYAGVDYADGNDIDEVGGGGGNGGDDYSDLVQNVGQSEVDPPTAKDDDGVHIRASFGKAKKKPVYLTLLRKDAIRSLILETHSTMSPAMELEQHVDSAFELWVDARCRSISRNFSSNAVQTLTNLRSRLGASGISQGVYIGAITDGNSNPDRVPELSGVFDFVIRAEDVGASKPDRRVYKAAVAALMLQLGQDGRSVEEFFLGESFDDGVAKDTYIVTTSDVSLATPTWKDVEAEAVEAFAEAVGPWWVHVGDDFFKDVVAAKELRMRTVWTRELIGGNEQKSGGATDGRSDSDARQRTVTDLVKDASKSDGVLRMSIGESEFLSQSLHDEFGDAVLDRFGDLGDLLASWHEEGLVARGLGCDGDAPPGTTDNYENSAASAVASGLDEPIIGASSASPFDQQPATDPASSQASQTKFCVFCGGRLPAAAKFCSHCGERQM